jgi:hypothetical protein
MRGLNDKLREEVEKHDVLKNTNSRTNVAFYTAEEDLKGLRRSTKILRKSLMTRIVGRRSTTMRGVVSKTSRRRSRTGRGSTASCLQNCRLASPETRTGRRGMASYLCNFRFSNASVRSLNYQAAYADATFHDLRKEYTCDLTLLHAYNSTVARHTKEMVVLASNYEKTANASILCSSSL